MDGPRLVARTVPWDSRDALALLARHPDGPRVLVEDPDGTVLAGVGAAATVAAATLGSADPLVRGLLADVETDGARPRLLGGFAFRGGAARAPWDAFPGAWFVLPRLLLAVRPEGATLTATVAEGEDPAEALAAARAARPASAPASTTSKFPREPAERARWLQAAADTVAAIRRGEAEKVVLARALAGESSGPVDPLRVVRALARPGAHRFLVEPRPGHAFFGATPEVLVSARGAEATTAAVAGTTPRGRSPAEEGALADAMLRDPKERHEHELVVDAIRRALTGLAAEIRIAGSPSAVPTGPLQHLVTTFAARLERPVGATRLASALHPTPAVGGSPTAAALALMSDAEGFDRGWYAGGVGWVGSEGDGTFLVAIRSALLRGTSAWAFAGAGLVRASDPAREWEETELKLSTVLDAFEVA